MKKSNRNQLKNESECGKLESSSDIKDRKHLKVDVENNQHAAVDPKVNFNPLVDSTINFKDDYVTKPMGELPLRIYHGKSSHRLDLQIDEGEAWRLSVLEKGAVVNNVQIDESGLNVATSSISEDTVQPSKFYLTTGSGKLGVNTMNPKAQLHLHQFALSIPLLKIEDTENNEILSINAMNTTTLNSNLEMNGEWKFNDVNIKKIDSNVKLGDSNETLVTQKAIKDYVTNGNNELKNEIDKEIANKANINGSKDQGFAANTLRLSAGIAAITFEQKNARLAAQTHTDKSKTFLWPKWGNNDDLYINFGNEENTKSQFIIRDEYSQNEIIQINKDKLTVNGHIYCNALNGIHCRVNMKGNLQSYYLGYYEGGGNVVWSNKGEGDSDKRLKKEIKSLTHVTEKLLKITGVSFEWNELGLRHKTDDEVKRISAGPEATEEENEKLREQKRAELIEKLSGRQIGLIAQEVEQLFPELVSEDEKGYKTINYALFTAVLIEAVKEQQKAYEGLSEQYETLAQRVLKLENKAG